ncbi:hypothetical protein J3458_019400 [Metarhizium acridum]|uniref:uncharacterized protein n=1 Tax=Metarhizium acridum TaxID=92637 RepID=UPI001C6B1638|nr:hypothetical protein J3458_019400 [Metarhizium acridum]
MPSSKCSHKGEPSSGGKSGRKRGEETSESDDASDNYSTICLTIFVFRRVSDMYLNRHILLYLTSPENPGFHETVHAQRYDEENPWVVDRIHHRVDWMMSATYLSHVNAGAVRVQRGEEMLPVNIVAATPVRGQDSGWNCQHFILEGLQEIVSQGLQTSEWYDLVEEQLTDYLLDGTVA